MTSLWSFWEINLLPSCICSLCNTCISCLFVLPFLLFQEDYINMNAPTIDQRLQSLVKTTTNNSQLNSHHFPSSSAVGTMIPTPGMAQISSTNSMVGPAENVMNASNAAAMVVQTTSNTGNLLPIANGLGGVGNATSFNMSDGKAYISTYCMLVNSPCL